MVIYLQTPRLILRQFTPMDAPWLFALDQDPEVMRYISDGAPLSREMFVERVLPNVLGWHRRTDRYGFFAAVHMASGLPIGWFHLRPDHENAADLDLGYRLKRHAWGHGFASEGSRALVSKAFRELGAAAVVGRSMAANHASLRVLEKAGLRLVGEFTEERFPGADRRALKYALKGTTLV